MTKRRTPRKTAAEDRALSKVSGYEQAATVVVNAWREKVAWGGMNSAPMLWAMVEHHNAFISLYDDDYKELYFPRVYGTPYERITRRITLKSPHPHAGRRGFVVGSHLDKHGCQRVWFLSGPGRDTNAYVKPSDMVTND